MVGLDSSFLLTACLSKFFCFVFKIHFKWPVLKCIPRPGMTVKVRCSSQSRFHNYSVHSCKMSASLQLGAEQFLLEFSDRGSLLRGYAS